MTTHTSIDEFRAKLAPFEGKACWAFTAGKGTGSHVSFAFGEKMPRKMRIDNPHLTAEQQLYKGEFGLFLNDCAWELQSLGAVLCDCSDDNSKDGPMLSGLRHLVGKKLEGIEVSNPSYDAIVRFEGGLELLLFCYHPDYCATTEVSYQYGFSTPEMTLGAEGTEGQWTLFVEVD